MPNKNTEGHKFDRVEFEEKKAEKLKVKNGGGFATSNEVKALEKRVDDLEAA
jgi:hypothetical protein